MGRKRIPGLYKRGDRWHIDKQLFGRRLCESTGTRSLEEAEIYLAKRIDEIRRVKLYGIRPTRSFKEAATKFLMDYQHKASIGDDACHLKQLDFYIGKLNLEHVHNGTLGPFIAARKGLGIKSKSINLALAVVRRILNLAATEWIDENGLTWLESAPKISMLAVNDARKPYPLSWDEQDRLFKELPVHLRVMALFKVNTGCREQEVCQLQWEWEEHIPELNTSVFVVPAHIVKNREDRLIILNKIAASAIEQVRGQHAKYVFSYCRNGIYNPVANMNNSAWKSARKRAGLEHIRVHDLKHTFGRRLRSAGVSFEDRQDLLGHKSTRITTHYSAAELNNLIAAANKVCTPSDVGPVINTLRSKVIRGPAVLPQVHRLGHGDSCESSG